MDYIAIVWLFLMVVFILLEANTVTVTTVWFAIGALGALIANLLGAALWLQVVIFFAVSVLLLAMLRPLTKKYLTPKLVKTNVDAVIGSRGVVTGRIDNLAAAGEVKLGAVVWTARSTTGEALEVGTVVKVDKVEGVKVYVTAVEVAVRNG